MIAGTYNNLHPYYGDLHNHCSIGYGHGSVEEAFENARLQLDFACVTAHGHWHDMPIGDKRLQSKVNYHLDGFNRTRDGWAHLQHAVEANNEPGRFITLLGFEWHSMEFGDHHICFKESNGEVLRAANLPELRQELRRLSKDGIEGIIVPHHIGYKSGYRGINWETFDPEYSPVAEIISMHGSSESDDAPYPYLHTMGPRDWRSTLQYGLEQGYLVGVVGSTDHHSAHPGSYGHGRAGVWAYSLTRDGIWEAIQERRTYALTGDRIRLAFAINDHAMGSVAPPSTERQVELSVEAGDAIEYVDLLYNNGVLRRWSEGDFASGQNDQEKTDRYKIYLEVGWGERNRNVDWEAEVSVTDGEMISIEPRFRGQEVLSPRAGDEEKYAFSTWKQLDASKLCFTTRTWGNPTSSTPNTQGICLEIRGGLDTHLTAQFNGHLAEVSLGELTQGSRTGYLGGFLTPAFQFHRAVSQREYTCMLKMNHRIRSKSRDWYYVRVRQKNGQYAWSSPIWVMP